ncbi:hypothetical protein O181_043613 [Austropuccinia psidii MF-1]|uniref:Uncharacterized protein n=1 Tax=Austropuccinia psidii MF-1 TaxID=1389203 RepID=A0A9Q3DLQ5_9BASI|nr:hypothetical protein [Austropuccinia psidii MF-1]
MCSFEVTTHLNLAAILRIPKPQRSVFEAASNRRVLKTTRWGAFLFAGIPRVSHLRGVVSYVCYEIETLEVHFRGGESPFVLFSSSGNTTGHE